MEIIREIVDASQLAAIVPLPESMRNKKVEITVRPVSDRRVVTDGKKKVSIARSLVGAIPDSSMLTREEIRKERLRKYDSAD